MPNKAFLHKKSLIDKFRDDHKKGTGYIQAARARRTWNNPMTRRKRTNKLNDWITSFAGKRHIRKLSRFNALKENNATMDDTKAFIKYTDDVLDILTTKYDVSRDELKSPLFMDMFDYIDSYWYLEKTPEDCSRRLSKVFNLKDKSEANYDLDDIKPLHGIAKSRFEGMSLQIEALCFMYADNGGLSDAQVEQLKELRDTIVVFGERAKPYIDWANEVIDGNESSKDEKLGYEKDHKNSHGEDAPWVIRSHKDNRILASFASEEDAKEHLKRMKQFSKEESMEQAIITNEELKKVVNAYLVSENDSAPMVEDVSIMEVTPVEDGQLIKFGYDGETTYCLVFGDPTKRRDNDLVYFMYDWQSGVDVNKENISDVDWILANEYVDIAGILEESNKSEAVKLTYVDTIRVPQWMWVADQTGDTSDLEDDEIEMLKEFQLEYKDKHLDDKGEDPYFSSYNDFDSLGGNVYDIDVYEMDNHQ